MSSPSLTQIGIDKKDLIDLTRGLVPEQKRVLTRVLNLAKEHVKARHKFRTTVDPILLVVQGGAGNFQLSFKNSTRDYKI